jgi:hypothetical protein
MKLWIRYFSHLKYGKYSSSPFQTIAVPSSLGKLVDPRDRSAGTVPCPAEECEVWITLALDNDTQLRIALENLKKLGVAEEDIARLHPEHPEPISLVGKKVCVRIKNAGGNDYWNLAWPREKLSMGTLSQAVSTVQAKLAAARNNSGGSKTESEVQR